MPKGWSPRPPKLRAVWEGAEGQEIPSSSPAGSCWVYSFAAEEASLGQNHIQASILRVRGGEPDSFQGAHGNPSLLETVTQAAAAPTPTAADASAAAGAVSPTG